MPIKINRLLLLSGKADAVKEVADENILLDNADEKEAEDLLKKHVKDVADRD